VSDFATPCPILVCAFGCSGRRAIRKKRWLRAPTNLRVRRTESSPFAEQEGVSLPRPLGVYFREVLRWSSMPRLGVRTGPCQTNRDCHTDYSDLRFSIMKTAFLGAGEVASLFFLLLEQYRFAAPPVGRRTLARYDA
jgi:hypothetical protein